MATSKNENLAQVLSRIVLPESISSEFPYGSSEAVYSLLHSLTVTLDSVKIVVL
jgi:hypothetical protein